MPKPLTQSLFKPTDFDLFLDSIGLSKQSKEARISLIDRMQQAVEYQIVTQIFSRLTGDEKLNLIDLMKEADETENEKPVNDFLLEKIPDIEMLVDEAIDKVKNDLRIGTAGMAAAMAEDMAVLSNPKGLDSGGSADDSSIVDPTADTMNESPSKIEPVSHAVASEPETETSFSHTDLPFPWEAPAGAAENLMAQPTTPTDGTDRSRQTIDAFPWEADVKNHSEPGAAALGETISKAVFPAVDEPTVNPAQATSNPIDDELRDLNQPTQVNNP